MLLPTYTPAVAGQCPPEQSEPPSFDRLHGILTWWDKDASARPDEVDRDFRIATLGLLNDGGIDFLVEWLRTQHSFGPEALAFEDLTNDGVRELVVSHWTAPLLGPLYVFGCVSGRWDVLLVVESMYEYAPSIEALRDVNSNGIKDLVVEQTSCHYCTAVRVYEWTGARFEGLIRDWVFWPMNNELSEYDFAELTGYSSSSVADIDSDGFYEILLTGGTPSYLAGYSGAEGPYREQTVVYKWTGSHYQFYSRDYADADFRYQAVQDGDAATEVGEYDKAIALYEDAVFDDALKSWSPEAWQSLLEGVIATYPDISQLPYNETEYEQLAAYARYRIMLIHLKEGAEEEALALFETTLEPISQDSSAYLYRELAAIIWSSFHSTGSIGAACSAAIQFTSENPEILLPISGDRYRMWDTFYSPEMVCPFSDDQ